MPKTRKLQLAFSGGEIDPQMYGRIDSPQYQSGLATCKNWMVDPRGTLRRRPGMQRVASSLDSANASRLIPFTYSVDQQLAVELTDQKIRFHANGQTVVWADLKKFDRFVTGNTLVFDEPHGFVNDERIVFYAKATTGGADAISQLPAPLNDFPNNNYHVQVVDSKRIKVLDDEGGSVVSLTDAGAGYNYYAFRHGGVDGKIGPAQEYRGYVRGITTSVTLFEPSLSSGFCLQFGTQPVTQITDWQQGERVQLVTLQTAAAGGDTIPVASIPQPLYVDFTAGGTAGCGSSVKFGLRTSREFVGTPVDTNGDTYITADQLSAAAASTPGAIYYSSIGRTPVWIRQFYEAGDLLYVNESRADPATPTWISAGDRCEMWRVTKSFGATLIQNNAPSTDWNAVKASSLEAVDGDGSFSLSSPFLKEELFDIEYDQSGDVVTLTHPNHPPQDLKRFDTVNWTLGPVDFSPQLQPPANIDGSVDRGQVYSFALGYQNSTDSRATVLTMRPSAVITTPDSFHPFAVGDTVYIANDGINSASITSFFGTSGGVIDRYYTVAEIGVNVATGVTNNNQITLRDNETGELVTHTFGTVTENYFVTGNDVLVYYSVADADNEQKYKVTAVDARGQESLGSAEKVLENVLSVPGSSNTITFDAVPNARSYNVYKEINGTFGFIGQVENRPDTTTYSFEDDNIGPDLSQTLLVPDSEVQGSFQPRAAARFEQRRCFGGSDALPRTLFMSRTGTESSFSYRFPIQPDDRISVDLASREAHVIRHIVPVQDLLMMTQQGEFRVTAINSDAITPNTIAIRQQSYVGSNNVHPQVVNNSVVFCSARGGHAREMNFRVESQGYLTGDLSLRAAHLFDGFTLNDLAYSKAPTPVLWFVSSSGKLLCLTYIPEEQVLAWHQHETEGAVESICSISEGDYDNLYVIVKRGSDRSVERLVQVREEALEDAVYLDASVSQDGTNTSADRFNILSSGLYQKGDTVTVTAMESSSTTAKAGLFSSDDVGAVLEFTLDGSKYRVSIDTYVSATQFTGKLLSDLPSGLRNTPTSSWAFAYKTFTGYQHLIGQTITVLADGVRQETVTVEPVYDPVSVINPPLVITDGSITLSDYAVKVCAGLPYVSQAKTLPMSLEVEAGAQGRTKNVNQVFVRVEDTGALQVGMDEADLKSVTELSNLLLKTGEFRTSVPSTWDDEGQIVVEATGAAPANLLNITTQVSIGD